LCQKICQDSADEAEVFRVCVFPVQVSAVLNCNAETARWYGEIKNALWVKGRPIPENDLWIAAIAPEHNLVLATRDAHFREIDTLKVEMWLNQ
jgi:tRNA(fMet)-specific endonuclease VapC